MNNRHSPWHDSGMFFSYTAKGYPVQINTIDLNQEWEFIYKRLAEIISLLV